MCRIPAIAEAGFQYVELPLCHVAALSNREFERLADVIHGSGLRSPAACNLFPDQMPLLGGQANPGEISAYLEHALCRASRLGIRKVVFASVSAWTASGSCQDRRAEIVELVRGTVAPAFQKYQIRLLLEGLRRQVCNAVNTLPEAAEICRQAAHPYEG
ncbi:MAG: sugar phosphate isomerase/epimerase family protein [Oscillospiraceae bacterium]